MDAGQLVPDEVTINMVRERLAEPDSADGFLLDGFPRTTPQANALDKLLADLGTALDIVLELVVDDDEVIRRLSGRAPAVAAEDLARRVRRAVARGHLRPVRWRAVPAGRRQAETIAERLRVYARDTAPLVDYYGAQGKLVGIDATGPVEDVTVRAIDALRSYGG